MCGIFGLSSSTILTQAQHRFIKQCTFVGTLRGVDSTGLALVDKNNNVEVYKKALAGPDFYTSRLGQRCLDELDGSFMVMGHNRAATRGKINDLTAHPFQYDHVTAVHNGTLNWQAKLPITKHTVDSENLIHSMSTLGDLDENNLAEFMAGIEGSYAITAYDENTELLWLVRNDERPLTYLTDSNGDLYWASEAGMLLWVAERVGIKFKTEDVVHLPTTKVVGFNTRTMEFVASKEYQEPVTHWTGYGNAYGGGGSYKGNHRTNSNTNTQAFDSVSGKYVKYVSVDDAVRQKRWSEDDRNLAIVYTNRAESASKNNGSSAHLRTTGVAFSSDGEAFRAQSFVSSDKVQLGAVYEGEVQTIIYDANNEQTIVRVTVAPTSLEVVHKAKSKAAKNMLKEMIDSTICAHGDLSDLSGINFPTQALAIYDDTGKTEEKDKTEKKEESNVENIDKARNKSNYVRGPANSFISEAEFSEMVADGCHHCKRAIPVDEAEKTGWLNNKHPICEDCIEVVSECISEEEARAL